MPATRYTDKELLATLKRLAFGEPTLGRRTYEQRRSSGDPSRHLYMHRFGSWGRALRLAGLLHVEQPLQLQDVTTKWSEPQILEAMGRCLDDTGSITLRTYETWRRDAPPDEQPTLPPATSIRARFGQWSRATALLRE